MSFPDFVKIVEVGPRDGLQNEPNQVSTQIKLEFIHRLIASGLSIIEVTSFVSPQWIPQLADHAELVTLLPKNTDVHFPVLIPNLKGLEAALAVGVKEISIFTTASDTFAQKNINCTIQESLTRYHEVIQRAHKEKLSIRAYISCAIACPYEGKIAANKVAAISKQLWDQGCYEISLGDTIGVATPNQTIELFETVARDIPIPNLAAHFHNTYGQALANLYAVLQMGVNVIDSSVAGLGGCPYARGASGNVATEDVLYLLKGLGIETNVDMDRLIEAGVFICRHLNRTNRSFVAQARG